MSEFPAPPQGIVNGQVTGDATLDYKLAPDVMTYVSVARGFKSGGFNGGVAFDPAQVTSFRPETLTSYEAGVKSRWCADSDVIAPAVPI